MGRLLGHAGVGRAGTHGQEGDPGIYARDGGAAKLKKDNSYVEQVDAGVLTPRGAPYPLQQREHRCVGGADREGHIEAKISAGDLSRGERRAKGWWTPADGAAPGSRASRAQGEALIAEATVAVESTTSRHHGRGSSRTGSMDPTSHGAPAGGTSVRPLARYTRQHPLRDGARRRSLEKRESDHRLLRGSGEAGRGAGREKAERENSLGPQRARPRAPPARRSRHRGRRTPALAALERRHANTAASRAAVQPSTVRRLIAPCQRGGQCRTRHTPSTGMSSRASGLVDSRQHLPARARVPPGGPDGTTAHGRRQSTRRSVGSSGRTLEDPLESRRSRSADSSGLGAPPELMEQTIVSEAGKGLGAQRTRAQCAVTRRCTSPSRAHRVMPVDVPVHLVLRDTGTRGRPPRTSPRCRPPDSRRIVRRPR